MPDIRALVQRELAKGTEISKVYFPEDSNTVPDDPRMTLVVMSPDEEWREDNPVAQRIVHGPGSGEGHPGCTSGPGMVLPETGAGPPGPGGTLGWPGRRSGAKSTPAT